MKEGEAVEECTSAMPVDSRQIHMSTAEEFSLTDQAKSFIEKLPKGQLVNNLSLEKPSVTTVAGSTSASDHPLKQSSGTKKGTQCHDVVLVTDGEAKSSDTPKCWIKINTFYLFESDRETLQDSNQWLNDNHMLCAQLLLRRQFPQFGGLQSTSLQLLGPP